MCSAPHRRAICLSLIWPAGSAATALGSPLFDPPEPQNIGKAQFFATCNYRERTKSIPDKVTTSLNNSELFHTSITAQGGRGTSKIGNIYHIGEVGSCDWWIAEGVEGTLEGKLPTKWTEGKALQPGRSSDVEKIRKGEDAGA